MKKFAITCINADGMRCLFGPNQGRLFRATRAEAESQLAALISAYSPELLAEFGYGYRVDEVDCYETGDAKGFYFKDPEAPFDRRMESLRITFGEKA